MRRSRFLTCLTACALVVGSALAGPARADTLPEPPPDTLPEVAGGGEGPPMTEPPLQAVGRMPATMREIDLVAADKPVVLRFGHDDLIKLTVLGYPELTQIARVQRDGKVTLPLIGEVDALQRTVTELRDEVTRRLTAETAPRRSSQIGVEDVLRMEVWRQPELTYTAPVTLDGNITLPLIGEIAAADRTLGEVREEARRRLTKYLRDPQISILIEKQVQRYAIVNPRVSILPEKLRERTVVMLGEVAIPGVQPMYGNLRVLDAISVAHYIQRDAALNDIIVIRDANSAVPQYKKLRIADYLDGVAPDQNIYLKPDDIVFVPKTRIAKVGEFIEQFFTRTKPIFDWWISLNQARYAEQYNKGAIAVYNRLYQTTGVVP